MMVIGYDITSGVVSIQLGNGDIAVTVELEPDVVADLDAAGNPLAVEFLTADTFVAFLRRHAPDPFPAPLHPLIEAARAA